MAKFTFGKRKDDQSKDLFSTTIFQTSRPAKLNEEQALQIPAVKSAIELLSSSISQLPIYLYENVEDKSISRIKSSRSTLLNKDSNEYETAQVLKKKIVQDYLLRGKSYIYMKNNKLYHLEAKNIQEDHYTDDDITISKKEFTYNGMSTIKLNEDEVIIIDSGTEGLLSDSGELFNSALSALEYSSSILKNGALPTGILKATSRLTDKAINRLRESWDNLYSGGKNAGKTLILEEGLEFKALSMSPDEMNLVETNKLILSDIARVFNIPESMINSSANKYNSIEQNSLQYLQTSLSPIITGIENAINKYLLDQNEKDEGKFFRFDTSELLRTNEKERIETVASALRNGLISFNEARHKLDLKPEDKDYYTLSIGQVLKYSDGSIENLNLGPEIINK